MKKIISLLLVAFILLAVAGCGANDSATSTSSKVSSEDIYTDASSDPSVTSEDVLDDIDVTASVSSKTSSKVNSTTSKTSSLKPTTSKTSSARPLTPNKIRRTLITQVRYKYFKQVGRCEVGVSNGLYLSWAGATVEFDLLCKDTISLSFSKSGKTDCFIEVYVDGVLAEERTRITKTGTYQVAAGLSEGVHRVKIVRETDAGQGSSILFSAIETYGNLVEKAPEDKELYIEAIGNANLIGWGVRLEDSFFKNYKPADKVDGVTKQEIARSFENMDSTLSYGSVAAKKLNADYYAIARQGAGIAATYHKKGDGTCNDTISGGLLPALYENVALGNSKKYEPKRTPDVIVIDAGETDINQSLLDCVMYNGKKGIDKATAKQIAKDFLLTLKQKNPGVKIIWCVGLTADSAEFKSHVKDIISMAGGEAAGIYYLELKKTTRSGYPSKAEHEAAGTLLANKIKAIIKK